MLRLLLAVTLCVSALAAQDNAANPAPSTYQDLRYRLIGPFRASRTVAGVGIPTQPNVFFAGVHTGGVWKTDDYGRTWRPIFDSAPTGSIGDIGVSWSNPDIIYVGTGEGLHRPDLGVGDGIFKSTDGGKSWKHVGLARRPAGRTPRRPSDRSRTSSSSPASGIRTDRTPSAASSARPTAARPGRGCSTSTRTPAASRSSSIRRIRTSSTARCGSTARGPGRTRASPARTAGSTSRPTAARPGGS